jgi:hypothetical protein
LSSPTTAAEDIMDDDAFDESNLTIEAWLGRRRPRHEAARLMGADTVDERADELDTSLRDLAMKPLTHFDEYAHPISRIHVVGTDWFLPRPRDLLRIYGPAGPDSSPDHELHYSREWAFTDPFGQVSVYARPDLPHGRFSAGHSLTSGYGQAFAALGVVIVPDLTWCELSVRPYVAYEGSTYLSGRRPRDAWENATATAWDSVGILIESWAVGGGAYHLDWDVPVVVSTHSEQNPSRSWHDFAGSVTTVDGLTAKVFASGSRRYRIWVYCWAEVSAQMLVSAGAYATTSISCWMPYLVVEQIPV